MLRMRKQLRKRLCRVSLARAFSVVRPLRSSHQCTWLIQCETVVCALPRSRFMAEDKNTAISFAWEGPLRLIITGKIDQTLLCLVLVLALILRKPWSSVGALAPLIKNHGFLGDHIMESSKISLFHQLSPSLPTRG